MMAREKQMGFGGGRPLPQPGSWLAGLMIGVTVSNLAAGAMMLGTGAAISKAILGKSPPNRGVRPA